VGWGVSDSSSRGFPRGADRAVDGTPRAAAAERSGGGPVLSSSAGTAPDLRGSEGPRRFRGPGKDLAAGSRDGPGPPGHEPASMPEPAPSVHRAPLRVATQVGRPRMDSL